MSSQKTSKSKVVDVHWHCLSEDWSPEALWQLLAVHGTGHGTGDRSQLVEAAEIRKNVIPKFWDPTGEGLIEKMDAYGIDIAIVLSDDFGLTLGEAKVPIREKIKAISAMAAKHPDRLKPCCVVDPRRHDAIEILEEAIKGHGMFGVGECHPDLGWELTSREAYRMFERLQEWQVPVNIHTGHFFPPLRSRLAHPLLLDDVCTDFPELVVIAGHSGRKLWWETFATVAALHPNLYGDISSFQTLAFNDLPAFKRFLRTYIDTCGPRKIMWATDDPPYEAVGLSTKKFLDIMRALPSSSAPDPCFKKEEIDLILGANAVRALKL